MNLNKIYKNFYNLNSLNSEKNKNKLISKKCVKCGNYFHPYDIKNDTKCLKCCKN